LDLSAATQPVLSFWQKYAIEAGYDTIKVDVSTNGGFAWTTLRTWWGTSTGAWQRGFFDLRPYRSAEVRIRFRMQSGSDTSVLDGWYLDDVRIEEKDMARFFFPFRDTFEEGTMNWNLSGSDWANTTSSWRSSNHSLTDSPGTNYVPNTDAYATLAHSVDLSSASYPVLSFWHKYAIESGHDTINVQVSTNGGFSWTTLDTWWGTSTGAWQQEVFDFRPYKTTGVRIRFYLHAGSDSSVMDGWHIDDVEIKDN